MEPLKVGLLGTPLDLALAGSTDLATELVTPECDLSQFSVLIIYSDNPIEVLIALRASGSQNLVIVVLTHTTHKAIVSALEAGADDCVPCTIEASLLHAHIQAVARRKRQPKATTIQIGFEALLSTSEGWVLIAGRIIKLTPMEAALLELLAQRAPHHAHRESIESTLKLQHPKSLDVLISRLRKMLPPGAIVTESRVGYRLDTSKL